MVQRLKSINEVKSLARSHTRSSINALAQIVRDVAQPASSRVSAAGVLLERGWGKADQQIEVTGNITMEFTEFLRSLDKPNDIIDITPDDDTPQRTISSDGDDDPIEC